MICLDSDAFDHQSSITAKVAPGQGAKWALQMPLIPDTAQDRFYQLARMIPPRKSAKDFEHIVTNRQRSFSLIFPHAAKASYKTRIIYP